MTVPTLAQAITALLSPLKSFRTKIEWLDWDEQYTGEYTSSTLEGNISVDASKQGRRSFSTTMKNDAGLFIPNDSLVNMRVKVRISRGINTPYGTYWWTKGIFLLTDPESIADKARQEVNLQGVDKWALYDGSLGGTFTDVYEIASGTDIVTALKAVAALQGETKFAFDACTETTPYQIIKEPGDTQGDLMRELADIVGYELFYDANGFMRFREIVDPLTKPILYDFSSGATYRPLYLSSSYKPEWSKIKNYWKVIGYHDTGTGAVYSGVAQDDDARSPTNTSTPPDGIGTKAAVINDSNLTSDDLCEARAEYELKQNLKKIDRSSHRLIACPFLFEQDCVKFEDDESGIVAGKYEIQGISEDFRGEMTVEAWRVV